MKRQIWLVAAALALCVLCGIPASAKASGSLKVGVRDDIMNFGYLNQETGNFYGMEIDLARELAKRLGYAETELVALAADEREDALTNGEIDCLIAAYSIADIRLEQYDFSEPYYHDATRVIVENSTLFDGLDDLIGKQIGIVDGSNAGAVFKIKMNELGLIPDMEDETIKKMLPIVKLESYAALSEALETGEIDAALMDGCIASAYMDEDRTIFPDEIQEQNYGVATQKGSELSPKVAEAVQEMLDDGTIDALIDKWD